MWRSDSIRLRDKRYIANKLNSRRHTWILAAGGILEAAAGILSTSSSLPHFPLPTLLLQLLLSPSTTIRLDGRAPSISDLVACFSLALSHILECPNFFTFTIAAALRLEAAACRLQERVHRPTISCRTGSDARGLFGSINNYARVHHSTPHQKHATARV